MEKGTIKKFNKEKGYGFIKTTGKDVFFHITDCNFENPSDGDKVSYELGEDTTGKGRPAKKVILDV